MKTWHYEIAVVAAILCATTLIFSNDWVNWISTVAILITFNHGQIGDRLQEQQNKLEVKTVECYHKLNKLFAGKEIIWIIAFSVMKNYAAIVGSVLFFLYPFWRKWYRKNIKPLPVTSVEQLVLPLLERDVIDHAAEREVMIKAFDRVRQLFEGRSWIMEGRGSYPYNDERYKEEVRYLYDEFDAIRNDTWKNIRSKSVDFRANTEFSIVQALIDDNLKWAKQTFPTANSLSCLHHLKKEVGEAIEAVEFQQMTSEGGPALLEFADMFLLLCQAAKRQGFQFVEIHRASFNKMTINKRRQWGKPNSDGFTEHIK